MSLKRFVFIASIVVIQQAHAQTWTSMGLDTLRIGDQAIASDLIFARSDFLYVGTNKGLYHSTNGGNSWQKLTIANGLRDSVVNALAVVPGDPRIMYVSIGQIGVTHNRSDLYRSTDGGSIWKSVFDSTVVTNALVVDVRASPLNPNVVFAVNRAPAPGAGVFDGIFKSTNGGDNWTYVSSGFSSSSHGVKINIALDPTNGSRLYGTGDTQFDLYGYASADSGTSWFAKSPLFDLGARQILVDHLDGNSIFVLIGNGRIHISRNGGNSWQINNGLNFRFTYKLTQDTRQLGRFLVGANDGVWMTKDSLNTWSNISGGLPSTGYYDVFVDPMTGFIYAGGLAGLYRFDPPTSVPEDPLKIPTHFQLYQNYPNPFNPTTTIHFTLPQDGVVSLKVFDMLGREVMTLINEYRNAGSHQVNFNASALTSGVYFYKLETAGKTAMQKMLLLK